VNDLELLAFWDRFCGNMYDETGTMCYWNYYNDEITEEFLEDWEQAQERAEFMADWDEYVNG